VNQDEHTDPKQIPALDTDHVKRMTRGNSELAARILSEFSQELPNRVEALARDVAEEDNEQLRKHAHALEGVCLTLGVLSLAACATLMEEAAKAEDLAAAAEILANLKITAEEGSRAIMDYIDSGTS
jgi:HPt (histidine-containing phosphotransfer) domain-containing protein